MAPENVTLKFKKIHPDARIPQYASDGASGMDVSSVENLTLNPLERMLVPTGLTMEIPLGYEIQVRPRSGMAAKFGVTVLNTPGTVDSDYRGELKVILYNSDREKPYVVNKGDRIAQIVLQKIERAYIEEADALGETTRGSGGFGSTGA